eukprot:15356533-Alexandrium_andersonii.AAC.1
MRVAADPKLVKVAGVAYHTACGSVNSHNGVIPKAVPDSGNEAQDHVVASEPESKAMNANSVTANTNECHETKYGTNAMYGELEVKHGEDCTESEAEKGSSDYELD